MGSNDTNFSHALYTSQKFKIVRSRPLLVVFQQIMRFIKLSKSIAIIFIAITKVTLLK